MAMKGGGKLPSAKGPFAGRTKAPKKAAGAKIKSPKAKKSSPRKGMAGQPPASLSPVNRMGAGKIAKIGKGSGASGM